VLEQHLDAGSPALVQALREGARHDDVAREVLAVKEAGVAFEAAVGLDALEIERKVLHLVGHVRACVRGAHHRLVPRRCAARCQREHAS
jgi:hypothetical protein